MHVGAGMESYDARKPVGEPLHLNVGDRESLQLGFKASDIFDSRIDRFIFRNSLMGVMKLCARQLQSKGKDMVGDERTRRQKECCFHL